MQVKGMANSLSKGNEAKRVEFMQAIRLSTIV